MFKSKKATLILTYLGVYLIATGISWAVFTFLKSESPAQTPLGDNLVDIRQGLSGLPKTESCPINGALYSQPEKEIWEARRPIAAVVENHVDSRPSSGLSRADIVYEAVAEGGITRFLSIFYCGAAGYDVNIAPVRSARVYYVNWAAEYGQNPIFMHVGGANNFSGTGDTTREAQALELLEKLGWRVPRGNDFDTTYDSGFPVFWRNYERLERPVATEHTMVASLDEAFEQAAKRGLGFKDGEGIPWDRTFTKWQFSGDSPLASPKTKKVSFGFWDDAPDYDVTWVYDQGTNSYFRENGGKKYVDLENDSQISAKNVVVMFVTERGPVDRNKHMLYGVIGEGKAIIFKNGDAITATWEKSAIDERTIFFGEDGEEINFVAGQIWIEAIPKGNDVDY